MSADDPDYFPPESEEFAVRQLHDINWIVANCTTPANLFHILRRQIALPFRKPLILMTPKSLLRHPEARSSFDAMLEGTEFLRIIPDEGPAGENPGKVKKVLFCSRKVFYDLKKARTERKLDDTVALVRVEQVILTSRNLFVAYESKTKCAFLLNIPLMFLDFSVPLRFNKERVRKIPQRRISLVTRRTQKPRSVGIRSAKI